MPKTYNVAIIYAQDDSIYLSELLGHLRPLEISGRIRIWTDRAISPGTKWESEIAQQLNTADIILLLISSAYYNSISLPQSGINYALHRHERGEAMLLPIITRPVTYNDDNIISSLQVLPTNGRAVTDRIFWPERDDAWINIVAGVKQTLNALQRNEDSLAAEKIRLTIKQESQDFEVKTILEKKQEAVKVGSKSKKRISNIPPRATNIGTNDIKGSIILKIGAIIIALILIFFIIKKCTNTNQVTPPIDIIPNPNDTIKDPKSENTKPTAIISDQKPENSTLTTISDKQISNNNDQFNIAGSYTIECSSISGQGIIEITKLKEGKYTLNGEQKEDPCKQVNLEGLLKNINKEGFTFNGKVTIQDKNCTVIEEANTEIYFKLNPSNKYWANQGKVFNYFDSEEIHIYK